MSGDPPLLTDAPLAELHERWREQGAPIANELRPGLTDEMMDYLTAPLGIRLPREARTLWGSHDGAPMSAPYAHAAWKFGAGWDTEFFSLQQCCLLCQEWRTLHYPGDDWRLSWLPIYRTRDPVVLDCAVEFEQPVPVYWYGLEDPDPIEEPNVRSLGELVSFWIAAIDCGASAYNRAEGVWDYDPSRHPEDLVLPGGLA